MFQIGGDERLIIEIGTLSNRMEQSPKRNILTARHVHDSDGLQEVRATSG